MRTCIFGIENLFPNKNMLVVLLVNYLYMYLKGKEDEAPVVLIDNDIDAVHTALKNIKAIQVK